MVCQGSERNLPIDLVWLATLFAQPSLAGHTYAGNRKLLEFSSRDNRISHLFKPVPVGPYSMLGATRQSILEVRFPSSPVIPSLSH